MLFINFLRSRPAIVLIFGCGVCFIAAAFLANSFLSPKRKRQPPQQQAARKPNPFFREGFDFNYLRSEDNEWKGPNFGEKIDLAQLKGINGTTPLSTDKAQLFMLVSVNPACGMCQVATDEMRYVHNNIALLGIPYYIVSFTPPDNSQNFFQYCDSLKLGVPAFSWASKNKQPGESLSTMVAPSHLLLNRDGVIVRTWPGSNEDKTYRIRMGKQIVADTNVITDTIGMLSQKSNHNN